MVQRSTRTLHVVRRTVFAHGDVRVVGRERAVQDPQQMLADDAWRRPRRMLRAGLPRGHRSMARGSPSGRDLSSDSAN
jgi:hypothetical protein